MDISIVVCTRNRAPRLANTLQYYRHLRASSSWELIAVNNGSTDGTGEVLAGFADASSLRMRIVNAPRPGASAGRNAGWKAAAGEVIAFTDDDCYPADDYIEQIEACFAARDLGYLGGRILLYDRSDYPVTVQPSGSRVDIAPRSFIQPGTMHGANMAFRRSVLEQVGGFDETLGPGTDLLCAEDVDLLARASAAGFTGAYDPRPTVFHHHGRSQPEDVRRLMAVYDIGRGAYYAKALMDPRSRRAFLWPVLRRMGGNLCRAELAVMGRELRGAWKYVTRQAVSPLRSPHE